MIDNNTPPGSGSLFVNGGRISVLARIEGLVFSSFFSHRNIIRLAFFVFIIQPIAVFSQPLEELIREAVESHPSILSGVDQVNASEYVLKAAKWEYYPTPSVSYESAYGSDSDLSLRGDDYVARVRLQQPLWTGGRIKAGVGRAKAGLAINNSQLQQTRRDIAVSVIQAYGQWYAGLLRLNAWQNSIAIHERLIEQVKHRVEEGVSAQSDLSLAQGRYESASAQLSAASASQEVSLSRLSQLVGRELELYPPSRLLDSEIIQTSYQELQTQAEEISPKVMQALSGVEDAAELIKQKKSEIWPDVYLRVEHQMGDYSLANYDNQTRIYVGFQSRFGAGLSTISGVDEARSRRRSALYEVEVQRRAVREQVQADYYLARSLQDQIAALNLSLETAIAVYESYGDQFLAGRKTWLDVMNSARDMVGIEVQLADAKTTELVILWRLNVITKGLPQALSSGGSHE